MTSSIIPPRVPFIDGRTGSIAREWYLFLLALRDDSNTTALDFSDLNNLLGTSRTPPVFALPDDNRAATARAQPDTAALERRLAAVEAQLLSYRRPNDSDAVGLINGDLGVGTRVPSSGNIGNTAAVTAGVFRTVSGTVASTTGVAITVATIPAGQINATYLVSVGLSAGAPATYSAVSIVSSDGGVIRATALQTATLMTITISGTNVQATQSSGGAQTLYFTLTRLS